MINNILQLVCFIPIIFALMDNVGLGNRKYILIAGVLFSIIKLVQCVYNIKQCKSSLDTIKIEDKGVHKFFCERIEEKKREVKGSDSCLFEKYYELHMRSEDYKYHTVLEVKQNNPKPYDYVDKKYRVFENVNTSEDFFYDPYKSLNEVTNELKDKEQMKVIIYGLSIIFWIMMIAFSFGRYFFVI